MHGCQRAGFVLLATLLLMVLLIAVGAELATETSTAAVLAARFHRTLAHQLAVDSSFVVLEDRLRQDKGQVNPLIDTLDRTGHAELAFELGEVSVRCVVRDDATKFNPNIFPRDDQKHLLTRKLELLAGRYSISGGTPELRPLFSTAPDKRLLEPYLWYDQLFNELAPGSLFRWDSFSENRQQVWSDLITLWGDTRVDVRRISPEMLDLVLEDIRPGAGRKLLADRPARPDGNFLQEAFAAVDGEVRDRVIARLAFDVGRYAIQLETAISGDVRRWYVVAQMSERGLSVLHRGPVTW